MMSTCDRGCLTFATAGWSQIRLAATGAQVPIKRRSGLEDGRQEELPHSVVQRPLILGDSSVLSTNYRISPPRSQALEALSQVLRRERNSLFNMRSDLAALLWQLVDRVQASDFCVSPRDVQNINEVSGVGYQDIYQGPDMTLCIFLLRRGSIIPLHDHPGMYVFGRLLFGQMRVLSYDLEPDSGEPLQMEDSFGKGQFGGKGTPSKSSSRQRRWARFISSEVLGPCPATYGLSPSRGNLHQLEALEDSAFFDVVSPPYNSSQGRDCTYFVLRSDIVDPMDPSRFCLEVYRPRAFCTQVLEYVGPLIL